MSLFSPQIFKHETDLLRYAFGFVDEFQDTSLSQFQLLTALWGGGGTEIDEEHSKKSSSGGSLTVVGDDDQMIYGWRDAMPDAFSRFSRAFPNAGIARLEVSRI